MTTFEMSVIFNADSEETAVGAVDNLGAAFSEPLTGWAASVKSIRTAQDEAAGLPENVRTFTPPVTITTEHWDEQQPKQFIDLDIEGNDPEFIVTKRPRNQEAEVGDPAHEDWESLAPTVALPNSPVPANEEEAKSKETLLAEQGAG